MNKNISLEWLNPETLKPNPMNWRTHPERQKKVLDAVLSEVGWAGVALFNKRTGHLIDGHARREWAIENKTEMPVLVGEWEEKDEKKILATLDPIATMAEQADEALIQLMEGIETQNGDLMEWADAVLGKLKGEIDDPNAEWDGMPEFKQEDKTAFQSVHIHFSDQEGIDAFAEIIGQKITPRTRSLWYPAIEIERYSDKRYSDES